MDWKSVEYDVIVVGSGATGGMAAKCLTDGGANVLLLEAGPELSTELLAKPKTRVEFEAIKARQPIQSRNLLYNQHNCHLFIDDLDNPYSTANDTQFNWIRSRQAGGRTLVWSRFALRMSEDDLRGPSPEGEHAWPLSYADLAPYYDKVEALIGVSGTRERISSLPDGQFLPCSAPPYLRALRERLATRLPEAHLIPSREAVGKPIATPPGPPPYSSLGSTLAECNWDKLTFRTDCVAAQIKLDRSNHANGIIFVDRENQRWHEVSGRFIVLCASTIESVRLLLASKTTDFPTGLGNSSGVLGRYLMDHFGGPRMIAVGKVQGAEPFSQQRAYIPRFDTVCGESEDFAGGFGIQAEFQTDSRANVLMTMALFGEVLPYSDNSVELDESTRDACGLAVPRVAFQYHDNEDRIARHAQAILSEIVDALGFTKMVAHEELLAPGTRAHELGGARMGSSADHSVLDPFNQCWDVPNLFVTDGSCFPSAGYKGPTLTMMALTARACDGILELLRRGTR